MGIRRPSILAAALLATAFAAAEVAAQASFTPSYNAPYRAFSSHEFGGTFTFPNGGRDFAVEGQYRYGQDQYDIGFRGGIWNGGSTLIILGVEGRMRVLDHTQQSFPLDGAIVVGVGTADFDSWMIPSAGLSLGRRVVLEDFEFIAYGQPTLFLTTGGGSTDFNFGLGLGTDFKIGEALDLRVSYGFIDGPEGLAASVVWIR